MDEYGVAKSPVGSMLQEIQALEDYGHDCCAHVDDRIHEHCKRIKDAYSNDVWTYQLALSRMESQEMLATYDVLGNERHKVICELRKSDLTLYPPEQFVETLYKMLYMTGCTPTNVYVMQKAVRDKLIHLLGGDTAEVEDGMDAGRCGETGAGGGVPAADKRCADCDDDQPSEGVAPITQELRDYLEAYRPVETDTCMEVARIGTLGYQGIMERLDAIDAVHANLERENEELRQRTMYPAESERINMLEREVKRLTAECKTQRNNFDQATSAREHWKILYEQSLEQIHDLEHDVEMWRDRAEDMRMERDDALHEHHDFAPESHYIMLPKDADGMPIHIGDLMEFTVGDPSKFVVDTLSYSDGIWAVDGDSPSIMRHAADSIEQIITDAINVHPASGFNPCWDIERDELVSRAKSLIGSS